MFGWMSKLRTVPPPSATAATADDAPRVGESAEGYKDRGNHHFAKGEYDAAAECYRQAIAIDPTYAEAYNNLGLVAMEQRLFDQAVLHFNHALALNPRLANAHFNLANLYQTQRDLNRSIDAYRQAVVLSPNWAAAHNRLGIALSERGNSEDAIACFTAAIQLEPAAAEAHYNLGDCYLECNRPDDAIGPTAEAIRLAPGFVRAHCNLGKAFLAQNRLDGALESFQRALALDPHDLVAANNLGVLLHKQDRLSEAIDRYEDARSVTPDDHHLLRNLGLALLGRGRLAEGWDCYEHRFFAGTPKRSFDVPTWAGEDLTGKSLLIWGEQGVGDEVLYAGLFPEVIVRARHCVIECAPKLVPLFSSSFPAAHIVPRSTPAHPATGAAIDLQCAAGMLAKWRRPSVESFPVRNAYLTPAADRVAFWRRRLAELGPGLLVGFSWRSHDSRGARSLYYTNLDQWGPIFAVPGVHFISLQYDQCDDELAAARQRFGIPLHVFDEVDLFDDLAEAAALKQALDLVISAPTATAFLSAAVGVPTWMMSYSTPWQTLGTDHVPWFPVMRCFPRRWDQPWAEIIATIAAEMRRLVTNSLQKTKSATV